MVNKSTNKTNNLLSSQITEHIKDHYTWLGNACPGIGQAQKCWGAKPVNGIPTVPHPAWEEKNHFFKDSVIETNGCVLQLKKNQQSF